MILQKIYINCRLNKHNGEKQPKPESKHGFMSNKNINIQTITF